MDAYMHGCMCTHVYACIYEFPYNNKQEMLEPKLFNIFC